MSKTKNYAVTIYNGKSKQVINLRAKSLNEARQFGMNYCRESKIIGGAVAGVVKL